jgi:hypothetical protein
VTISRERTLALLSAKQFLYDLIDSKKTKKVPGPIRDRAAQILKHFADNFIIRDIPKYAEKYFEKIGDNNAVEAKIHKE